MRITILDVFSLICIVYFVVHTMVSWLKITIDFSCGWRHLRRSRTTDDVRGYLKGTHLAIIRRNWAMDALRVHSNMAFGLIIFMAIHWLTLKRLPIESAQHALFLIITVVIYVLLPLVLWAVRGNGVYTLDYRIATQEHKRVYLTPWARRPVYRAAQKPIGMMNYKKK